MKILADVGNTNVVIGFWDECIIRTWRLSTSYIETEDQLYVTLKILLSDIDYDIKKVESIIVCSVVPGINRVFSYFGEKYFSIKPLFVSARNDIGIGWNADNPEEIGADRICNVIGAIDNYEENSIVIDFGTAVTVDIVKNGDFVGGCILPGPKTAMKALFSNTAKLPEVDLFFEDHYLGVNTADNIRIGIINGTYFALKGIIESIKSEAGDFRIIATGGLAKVFFDNKGLIDCHDPDLTLKGLYGFYRRVKG